VSVAVARPDNLSGYQAVANAGECPKSLRQGAESPLNGEAISLLRFEHHHEGRAGIIAKASRSC
jgi:hypothetical protein